MQLRILFIFLGTFGVSLQAQQPKSKYSTKRTYQKAHFLVEHSDKPTTILRLSSTLEHKEIEKLKQRSYEIYEERKIDLERLQKKYQLKEKPSCINEIINKTSLGSIVISSCTDLLGGVLVYAGLVAPYTSGCMNALYLIPLFLGSSLVVVSSCLLGTSIYGFVKTSHKAELRRAYLKAQRAQQILNNLEEIVQQKNS